MPTILQVNFNYDISEEELARRSTPERAKMFLTLPGLRWKVWIRDTQRRESGGIYLFDDREAAQAYLDGPIVAAMKSMPDSTNLTTKLFEVREEVSAVTRAPLGGPAPVKLRAA